MDGIGQQNSKLQFFDEGPLKQKTSLDLEPGYNMYLLRQPLFSESKTTLLIVNYSHNPNKPTIEIEGYDNSYKKLFSNKYTPFVNQAKAQVIGAFNVLDKPYLILAQNKAKEKKIGIYLNRIKEGGEVIDSPILVDELKNEEDESGFSIKTLNMKNWVGVDKQNFNSVISDDRKHIGLFYRKGSFGSKGSQVYILSLDDKLNKNSKLFNLETNYIDFLNEGMYISNDGSIIFNYSEKKQKDNMGIPLTRVQYGLILTSNSNKQILYNELFGKKFVYETVVNFDKDNNPRYFYSYREGSNDDEIEGVGFGTLNKSTLSIANKREMVMDKKNLSIFGMKKFDKEYNLKNFFVTPDDDKYIVYEKFKTRGMFNSMYKTHTNFLNSEEVGQIVLLKFNSQCQLKNLIQINKEGFKETLNDYRGVYSYLLEDKLNLIYNTLKPISKNQKEITKYISGIHYSTNFSVKDSIEINDASATNQILHPYSMALIENNSFFGEASNIESKKTQNFTLNFIWSKPTSTIQSNIHEVSSQEIKLVPSNDTTPVTSNIKMEEVRIEKKVIDSAPKIIPNPQYSDVNAAYKAELDRKNAEFEAANAKAATIADKVEYYKKLREKFDEEAREKRIKDSLSAIESARKAAQAFDARHLKPEQAPQFEKHRNGFVDVPEKKKTAEEEYNELFK